MGTDTNRRRRELGVACVVEVAACILDDVIQQARFYFYYGTGSPAAVGRA
jgi:hypothetical protein